MKLEWIVMAVLRGIFFQLASSRYESTELVGTDTILVVEGVVFSLV